VLLGHDVLSEALRELRQVQVEVRGLADLRRPARYLGVRIDELVGLVPRAAVIALVTPGLLVAAHRARPLDVAVGQEPILRRTVHLLGLRLRDVAALLELAVEELSIARVQLGRGVREVVEGDPEPFEGLFHVGPPVVYDLPRRFPLALGPERDGNAVVVRAADVDHVLTTGA
jgi:hypothetical protein